jgi:hypothetical protein
LERLLLDTTVLVATERGAGKLSEVIGVVIGANAAILQGVAIRTTLDVDITAAVSGAKGRLLGPSIELPAELARANGVRTGGRDALAQSAIRGDDRLTPEIVSYALLPSSEALHLPVIVSTGELVSDVQ